MFYGGTQLLLYNLDDSAADKSLHISHTVSCIYRSRAVKALSKTKDFLQKGLTKIWNLYWSPHKFFFKPKRSRI